MKASEPPRLALALLRRFAGDNEPLVGDLLETFARRPSRWWFWRQTVLAVLIRVFSRRGEERPLVLVERTPFDQLPLAARATPVRRINLTASPIHGVGGLGLLALAIIVTLVRPHAWWIFLLTVVGGVVVGTAMVIIRRRRAFPWSALRDHLNANGDKPR